MPEQPDPNPDLRKLDALVGLWNSYGETVATADQPSIAIHGTDHYEWLPGGFFLIHRVDVKMGDNQTNVVEIIGGDDPSGRGILMRSFDNSGSEATMYATIDADGAWHFTAEKQRTTLVIDADGQHMVAHWEQSDDGQTWQPWMEMRFTRAK